MRIDLEIPGIPIAQPRVKATAFGSHARVYTPNKNGVLEYKATIRMVAKEAFTCELLNGPVRVNCEFVFPRPADHYGTGRNAGAIKASAPIYHTSLRDRDNLDKAVLDALSGVVLSNDKCVCDGRITKRYVMTGEQPHTKITIRTL